MNGKPCIIRLFDPPLTSLFSNDLINKD